VSGIRRRLERLASAARGRSDEKGSTLVEFAFVSTVVFGLFLGLVGLSLIEIGDSVGTNAAREGARAASMSFLCADAQSPGGPSVAGCSSTPGPTDAYTAIVYQVQARLAGLIQGPPVVVVQCFDGSLATPTAKPCDQLVVAGTDLVKVTVQWAPLLVTSFVASPNHTSSATTVIIGSTPAVAPPPSCKVTSSTFGTGVANPNAVTIAAGALSGPLVETVALTANTTASCASLYVNYHNTTGSFVSVAVPMNGAQPSFALTLPSSITWTADTYTFVFTDSSGAAVASEAATLHLVVTSATVCSLSSSTVTPTAVPLVNGAVTQGGLVSPVVITAITAGSCTGVNISFNTGTTFVTNVAMTGAAGIYATTIAALTYAWTTGIKLLSFSNPGGPAIGSASLSVNAGCALRFEVDGPAGSPVLGMKLISAHTDHLSSAITLKATPVGAGCTNPLTFDFNTGSTHVVTAVTQASGVYQLAIAANTYNWAVGTVAFAFTYGALPIAPNPTQTLAVCKSNASSCP
jgi:hypothetical protein